MPNTAIAPDAFQSRPAEGKRAHLWLAVQALRTVAAAHQARVACAPCHPATGMKVEPGFSRSAANDSRPLRG